MLEPQFYDNQPDRQGKHIRADLSFRNHTNKRTSIDVTVIDPTMRTYCQNRFNQPGSALKEAEKKKYKKMETLFGRDGNAANGDEFIAFSMSVTGEFGDGFNKLVRSIERMLAERNRKLQPDQKSYWRSRIGVALHNAMTLGVETVIPKFAKQYGRGDFHQRRIMEQENHAENLAR